MATWRETELSAETSVMRMQKWGGLASFLLIVALIVPPWIYLTGNLRSATGPFVYGLADFLSGPVRAACLVMALVALRERIGERAPRRTTLALIATLVSAGMMVGVACIRSTNRQYLFMHPELSDTLSMTLLTVWSTIVTGMSATGWHFLGWALVLVGSAGWTTRRLPRALSVLYWVAGATALFGYLLPEMEGIVTALFVVVSIWQGIVLWKFGPGEPTGSELQGTQPEHA